MKRFALLYQRLDRTTRLTERIAALREYFESAPPADAAWALALLTGERPRRAVSPRLLREWVSRRTGLPDWIIDASYEAVGDLSETIALLIAPTGSRQPTPTEPPPLAEVMNQIILPLTGASDEQKHASIAEVWDMLTDPYELLVFHKLISGAFRVGVSRGLIVRALAEHTGLEAAVVDHRLLARWKPTAEHYLRLIDPDASHTDHAVPYPFFLASPIEESSAGLGPIGDWLVEYKWDGVRAQLIRRSHQTVIWSRGNEIVTDAFPDLAAAAHALPDGLVIDAEILAWHADKPTPHTAGLPGRPLPFSDLQRRLNRKRVEPTLFPDVPVVLMAYDLLEHNARDMRTQPMADRRELLVTTIRAANPDPDILLSPMLTPGTWDGAAELKDSARDLGAEGLMLKRLTSRYQSGRVRGDWWKWKADPFTIDAVLVAAQPGTGRRAGLYTDYTFAVWDGDQLTPIAKAYSGLTDEEFVKVDDFIRKHTRSRHGPVRAVKPELVFELAFEGVRPSPRHKSGLALRFPRMKRWRTDKSPREADTIDALRALERSIARATRGGPP